MQECIRDYKEQKFGIQRMFEWKDAYKMKDAIVGDCLELRDFSMFIPKEYQTEKGIHGADEKWGLMEYRLIDGTKGNMLYVNYKTKDVYHFTDKGMPPVLEIRIPLQGRYAIWVGIPVINLDDLRVGGQIAGIDLALDNEVFMLVQPKFSCRYGRLLGETGREYQMLWKNADLNQSTLKIRVMFGTYSAASLGHVSAILSSLRFVKLPDDETLGVVKGKADKDVVMIVDGFSHYSGYGLLGECMDLRLNRAYENSDVRKIMWQTMSPTMWKSKVNSYLGEGVTEEEYEGKRICDRRVMEYTKKSIELEQEALRLQTEDCHRYGMEMHYSIRANLHFATDTVNMKGNDYMNGRWWHEHPDCRLPKSVNLDYGKKEVRQFFLDMFHEALELFDIDGINLDLTRWPKVLDSKYHSMDLLVDFCREMRALADNFGKKRGKHINVSLSMVEYFHAGCSLEEQAIDFEAVVASRTLDFICLQAFKQAEFAKKAHKYGVKLYGILEHISPYTDKKADANDYDVLWRQPNGTLVGDSKAGEEYRDVHPIMSDVGPIERYRMMAQYYDEGDDGVAIVNDFLGTLYFRDCGHSDIVRKHAKDGTVYGQEAGEYIFTF